MAPVPLSVSRSIVMSSAFSRKTLWFAEASRDMRSLRVVMGSASVILIRKGSMMVRMFLARFAEGEVDAMCTGQGMLCSLKRQHAMVSQPGGASPNDYVAVEELHALRFVRPLQTTEKEYGRHAQRHRDNRLAKIRFVFVLVERHLRARFVTIH